MTRISVLQHALQYHHRVHPPDWAGATLDSNDWVDLVANLQDLKTPCHKITGPFLTSPESKENIPSATKTFNALEPFIACHPDELLDSGVNGVKCTRIAGVGTQRADLKQLGRVMRRLQGDFNPFTHPRLLVVVLVGRSGRGAWGLPGGPFSGRFWRGAQGSGKRSWHGVRAAPLERPGM